MTDIDIKALIERVRKGIAPEPLCRDCADNNGRCPVDNELCDSNERAVEVAEAVRTHIEQLESERDEAYQQGRESMREEAAGVAESFKSNSFCGASKWDVAATSIAKAIREIE